MREVQKKALVAGAMSLLVPGLGHFVHRAWVVGVFWIGIAVLFWNSSKAPMAFTVHLLAAVSAYWTVQRAFPDPKRRRKL